MSGGGKEDINLQKLCTFHFLLHSGWRATPQRKIRPPKEGEVVDIGAKFGVTLGSDSDSSDAEFTVEDVEPDSEGMAIRPAETSFSYLQ